LVPDARQLDEKQQAKHAQGEVLLRLALNLDVDQEPGLGAVQSRASFQGESKSDRRESRLRMGSTIPESNSASKSALLFHTAIGKSLCRKNVIRADDTPTGRQSSLVRALPA
jgi:hypothetical protein